jgi:hypothetical protein
MVKNQLLLTSHVQSVLIMYTVDHHIISWCQITDRRDNAAAYKVVCDTIADILFPHPATSVSIRWVPGSASFRPLKLLQEIATEAAAIADPAPTITAPAYRAFHRPPSGHHPDLMLGIANSTRPVLFIAIRLLNGTRLHR